VRRGWRRRRQQLTGHGADHQGKRLAVAGRSVGHNGNLVTQSDRVHVPVFGRGVGDVDRACGRRSE
jgi:hypothetical protein